MKVFVTGGTGFIGTPLVQRLLNLGHQTVVCSRRSRPSENQNLTFVTWNGKDQGEWTNELNGCDGVINLAGEGIFERRWTKEVKQSLIDSRLDATGAIVEAIKNAPKRPPVLVSASAVGFYGDTKDAIVDETTPPGDDFLADVCMEWEEEARRAVGFGVRVAHPRIGIVLGRKGGALKQMLPPFKAYVGGAMGSGLQWFPWAHIDDVIEAVLFPLKEKKIDGPYNVAAPECMRMSMFCKLLGKVMGRPSWVTVPAAALKLILGEAAGAILSGQHISCKKLEDAGFKFKYPKLETALKQLLD